MSGMMSSSVNGLPSAPFIVAPVVRVPGELYGEELAAAVLKHLHEHPVGLTSREIARAFHFRSPDGGGSMRVLFQLWKLFHVGKVGYVVTPRLDGSNRTTRRWSLS